MRIFASRACQLGPVLAISCLCHAWSASGLTTAAATTQRRVALVTGANKGIGKEIARQLASEKNIVCILGCRDEKLGAMVAEELREVTGNDKVCCIHVDLDDVDSLEEAARSIDKEYGRLDVLVNNAAVCFNDATLYGKVPHTPFQAQADVTVRTNFFGTLRLTRALLPMLRKAPSPRIVNIASSAGRLAIFPSNQWADKFSSSALQMDQLEGYVQQFVTDVQAGTHAEQGWPNTCYGLSKVGIIAMTKILARDEPNIMVNSVDPGYCATDQNNNQGVRPAKRGAVTPFLLATLPDDQFFTGRHWFDEQEIQW